MAARESKVHAFIPRNLKAWLERRAREEDRSLSNYVARVLEDHRARITAESPAQSPEPAAPHGAD